MYWYEKFIKLLPVTFKFNFLLIRKSGAFTWRKSLEILIKLIICGFNCITIGSIFVLVIGSNQQRTMTYGTCSICFRMARLSF